MSSGHYEEHLLRFLSSVLISTCMSHCFMVMLRSTSVVPMVIVRSRETVAHPVIVELHVAFIVELHTAEI